MICLMTYTQPNLSLHSRIILKPTLYKGIPTLVFRSCLGLFSGTDPAMCLAYRLGISDLVLCNLESVNRWRLRAIKVLLEFEFFVFFYLWGSGGYVIDHH